MSEYTLFWILLILISGFLLRQLYFAHTTGKLHSLRGVAVSIELGALALFFMDWLPAALSSKSGFELIAARNIDVAVVLALIVLALAFFVSNRTVLVRAGAGLHIAASIISIGALLRLMPDTYSLRLGEMGGIFLLLLLLIGNVIVLLLWHQLQLQEGKKINIWGGKKLAVWLPIFLIAGFGYWYTSSQLGRATIVYESERYGYAISVPRAWRIDDSQNDSSADFISSPGKEVLIFIQRLPTPNNISGEEIKGAIREELERSPAHTIEIFDEREWKETKTIYAAGVYNGGDGPWPGIYRFYEYNAFLPDRSVFTLRINIVESKNSRYGDAVTFVADSLVLPRGSF